MYLILFWKWKISALTTNITLLRRSFTEQDNFLADIWWNYFFVFKVLRGEINHDLFSVGKGHRWQTSIDVTWGNDSVTFIESDKLFGLWLSNGWWISRVLFPCYDNLTRLMCTRYSGGFSGKMLTKLVSPYFIWLECKANVEGPETWILINCH